MNETALETPSPEVCASKIFEISGTKLEPDIAADLWPKILQHKWLLSEKLNHYNSVGLLWNIVFWLWSKEIHIFVMLNSLQHPVFSIHNN